MEMKCKNRFDGDVERVKIIKKKLFVIWAAETT